MRDSPALNVAGMLQLNGATVNVYDPKAIENSRRLFPTLNYSTSVVEACERADAVLVLTEWREFTELDPPTLPRPYAPKSLWTAAIASMSSAGRACGLAGVLPGQEPARRSVRRPLFEHSVEALPQQHEDEFDDALAWHVTVLVPPARDAMACRLSGAGEDPRRLVDGDALHRF